MSDLRKEFTLHTGKIYASCERYLFVNLIFTNK